MGFFAMMFLFFAFMRMIHGRCHHSTRLHYYGARRLYQLQHRPQAHNSRPAPNAYEQLKQRYVRGDIDVDQYERELDEMLRSPDGHRIVN